MAKKTAKKITESKRAARDNKARAEKVREALQTMRDATQTDTGDRKDPLRSKESYELALTDLLANARHFCDAKGLDYADCDESAYGHYSAEVVQARTGVSTPGAGGGSREEVERKGKTMSIKVETPYGTAYAEALDEAQKILAAAERERDHEDCAECRGELSAVECGRVKR